MRATILFRACLTDMAWPFLQISPSGVAPISSLMRRVLVTRDCTRLRRPALRRVSRVSSTK